MASASRPVYVHDYFYGMASTAIERLASREAFRRERSILSADSLSALRRYAP